MIFRLIPSFSRVSVLIQEHSYLSKLKKLSSGKKMKKPHSKFLDKVIENLKLKCKLF